MSSEYSWYLFWFFCFKQKTAYEVRISDWSSDVCSSDLLGGEAAPGRRRRTGPMQSTNDIRSHFLDYFGRHGHEVVASGPLVPRNDPTLLFTNAGKIGRASYRERVGQ